MSSDAVIEVEDLGKAYQIYAKPIDRLKQAIVPRLQRGLSPAARMFGRTAEPRPYFDTFWALRNVNFTLTAGETLGIIGENGSGKSTLLQLVCGTLNPTTGSVKARGRVAAILELGSGFNPEFTGRENIYLNAMVLGLSHQQVEARFDDIVAFADIGEFIDQPIKTYSSGMGMRLAFSVITHVDADVLVVDEALAVGDAYFQLKCMRWLRQFRERGTILFCTHDTASVINLCQRAIWLEHGNVRAFGPAKEVSEAYLASIYTRASGLGEDTVKPARERLAARTKRLSESHPNLKQHIEVFEFNENSASFGSGDATVTNVRLLRPDGRELGAIHGGETVQVIVDIRADVDIEDAIVGFHVKDRLGQRLFGDNTYLQYRDRRVAVRAGDSLEARFTFELPFLQTGDYSINAAIASGTLESHVYHHRVHDGLVFHVESPFRNGVMFAIPMQSMTLDVRERMPVVERITTPG